MKQFISVKDVKDVKKLIYKAIELKKNTFLSKTIGNNKTIGLVFFNPSLRTRLSSQKAAFNIGCNTWILNINSDSWKIETSDGSVMNSTHTQEHIKEAIGVMSLYCDILAVRTFPGLIDREYDYKEILLKKIINYSKVPVVNLESATLHPLQSLADLITIEEFNKIKKKLKIVLSWAPHIKALPQSVPNSFIEWVKQLKNIKLYITNPDGYNLNSNFTNGIKFIKNQNEAFKNADFIYAKNWSSYDNYGKILCKDLSWTITNKKMKLSNNAKFMHCLPVRRNLVVEDSVLDDKNSIVLNQAENRIFATQTVFLEILENI
ncbi:Rossmann-fold NAD(P)-binding domain-containing protein [Candidatus Karelsulcia muelleri]|uniref:acetylornithine carbamoyltransferase n=1 Tax=Candidatus Karelsulcia muelleri TaxID=336810 RepID=UPI000B92BDC6|nr:acetylornithine carbamoyltransferase [Candidatus Karelsulcia muelleri]ASS46887.1 N-acetylornithine carbamoyltransferase [Candidatus Karelsulcia muelleri]